MDWPAPPAPRGSRDALAGISGGPPLCEESLESRHRFSDSLMLCASDDVKRYRSHGLERGEPLRDPALATERLAQASLGERAGLGGTNRGLEAMRLLVNG